MNSMASAARAEFFDGKLFSLALLVFTGDVVAPFAAVALEADKIPHFHSPVGQTLTLPLCAKPTMGIGPMTSSLPRKCSAD